MAQCPEEKRQYQSRYNALNKEAIAAKARERRAADPTLNMKHGLRKRGMTLDEYDKMLREQDYRCKVCGTEKPGGKGRFHVDHNHNTKRNRGLLCHHCNTGLGHFKDSPALLLAAQDYLLKEGHYGPS